MFTGKKYEPEPYSPPLTDPSPVPPISPGKNKKGDKKGEKAVTPEPPPTQVRWMFGLYLVIVRS